MNASLADHTVVITARQAVAIPQIEIAPVLAQFVFPTKEGLFRIVRHGHRWRSLLDAHETGRHPTAPAALETLRLEWPRARLPARLEQWRYLPESALAHSRLPLSHTASWMAHERRRRRSPSGSTRGDSSDATAGQALAVPAAR